MYMKTHKMAVVATMVATCSLAAMAAAKVNDWIVGRTEPRAFVGGNGKTFLYRWAEKKAADGAKVPLVVFLHGAGERGTNNVAQLLHGVTELVKWLDAHEKGFKLFAGQVPAGKRWVEVPWNAPSHAMPAEPSETMGLALELLDALCADPSVDTSRVYVTGISMGGYGTWDMACRRPGLFAAAMPICGGADEAQAPKISKVPLWVFHGSKDGAVPVSRSRNMVSALWAAGSDAHYREYPDWGHNVWTATYGDAAVLKWFFAQRKEVDSQKRGAQCEAKTP